MTKKLNICRAREQRTWCQRPAARWELPAGIIRERWRNCKASNLQGRILKPQVRSLTLPLLSDFPTAPPSRTKPEIRNGWKNFSQQRPPAQPHNPKTASVLDAGRISEPKHCTSEAQHGGQRTPDTAFPAPRRRTASPAASKAWHSAPRAEARKHPAWDQGQTRSVQTF